jgi:hypothetical protein
MLFWSKLFSGMSKMKSQSYAWVAPSGDQLPKLWGSYDDENSTFGQWRLLGDLTPSADYGEAIIRFRSWTLSRLSKWHCPPTISQPIVDIAVQAIIQQFAGIDDVVFYPVSAVCKDGVSHSYSFVSPRHRLKCIDFKRSDYVPNPLNNGEMRVTDWKVLYFHAGCLGDKHIAWEEHLPGCIVVSEALRDALMEINDPGIAFVLPENYVRH